MTPDADQGNERQGVLRPEAMILGESAVVPADQLIRPAPNRFTHELLVDQPYWFGSGEPARAPDGVLAAGSQVVLLVQGLRRGGVPRCRVVDGRGLYVEIDSSSLRPLDPAS